tara:strand:- start:6184 stop:7581 length:1398 start_codon:yes stop_codon:yes gene_type:complete
MVSLEKIIRKSAESTEPIVDLSGTQYRDKRNNSLLRISDVASIPHLYSQIEVGDRNNSREVFVGYFKLDHGTNITGGSFADKPGRSKTKDENFLTFFNNYMHVYDTNSRDKRKLFNEGMLKAIQYASVPTSLTPVFQLYENLLKFDEDLIKIWNKSLDCVTQKPKDVYINKDQRLLRYLKLSKSKFHEYHSTYKFVFDILGKKSDLKASLFEIEDFLFDLSKANELEEADIWDYYKVLRVLPSSARRDINSIRESLHSEELDNAIYELYAIPEHDKETRINISSFLRSYSEQHKNVDEMLEIAPVLAEAIKGDRQLLRKTLRLSENLLSLEAYKKRPIVRPYLETISTIPNTADGEDERFFNARLAAQIFRDYALRDDYDVGNVRDRYNACSKELSELEGQDREIAINTLSNLIDNVERSGRLVPDNSVLIDEVFANITKSFSIDSQKAGDFVNAVVEYERGREW